MLPQIVAGDTLTHSVTLADYPASAGWVLSYRLAPRLGGSVATFNATADGDSHAVSVAAATTTGWAPGEYTVAAWVTLATARHSVASESGQVRIWPNPATISAGTDTRTPAAIALANVTATLQGRATSAVLEYEINGRRLRYIPHADLISLQSTLRAEVQREEKAADIAAGLGSSRGKVYVRMARA